MTIPALDNYADFWLASLIGVIGLSVAVKKIKSKWVLYFIYLPSTVLHETLHFIVALVTFASPVGYNVIPKKENGVLVLGSVQCSHLTNWNAPLVAMAPLLALLVPFVTFDWIKNHPNDTLLVVGAIACNEVIMLASIPSSQDFKVAFRFWLGSIGYLMLVVGTIYFGLRMV